MTVAGGAAPADGDTTEDALLRGRIRLLQPVRGLRASLDPVLLAGFVQPPFGDFLDLGCGSGVLAFLLLARDPAATGLAVDIQPRLADLARRGAEVNGFAARLKVIAGDVRQLDVGPRRFSLIATNPPFRPIGSGVLPPDRERSLAHFEVALTLREWVRVTDRLLSPDGRLAVIYPAARLEDLQLALSAHGFRAVRVRMVVPRADEPPGRVLVEARRGTGSAALEPPLVVHQEGGFSPEVRRMLGEE